MYITNQQLISQRTAAGGDQGEFSEYLSTVLSLVKKYGSSSVKGGLFESIQQADTEVAEVVQLLDAVGKLDQRNLSSLYVEIGGGADAGYIVKSSNPDTVENTIQPSADKVSSNKIEVQISGDGKIYKRGLERDLGKMLR